MSICHDTTVAERRESTRFAKERGSDFAVIYAAHSDEQLVEVYDESLGGLAIYLDHLDGLDVGHQLNVVYAGTLMQANVRHLHQGPSGEFIVGLQCERLE